MQTPTLCVCVCPCVCVQDRAVCVAMQRLTAQLVVGLLAALLAERSCRADGGGGPSLSERVIWAVNAGGDTHVDVHGIHFKKDPLEGKVGKGTCVCVHLYRCDIVKVSLHAPEVTTD